VGIETHCSRKLVFREKLLGEEDDAAVSVVRTFRKHVGDRLVGLLHEIVDNHQSRFFTVSPRYSEDPGEILCGNIG